MIMRSSRNTGCVEIYEYWCNNKQLQPNEPAATNVCYASKTAHTIEIKLKKTITKLK